MNGRRHAGNGLLVHGVEPPYAPSPPRIPRLAALAALLLVSFASSLRAQQPDALRLPMLWKITEGRATVTESFGVISPIAVDNATN